MTFIHETAKIDEQVEIGADTKIWHFSHVLKNSRVGKGCNIGQNVVVGTDALIMALMAHGIGQGDAVFTTPFTFVATAEAIRLLGAVPVFVDIDPDTFNISVEKLEAAVGEFKKGSLEGLRPRAVIPVDLFGLPCDY